MELAEAARDEATFSMRVLRHLARPDDESANLAVSPLSIHAALVLLGAGARGATLDQIASFLSPAGAHAHAILASHVALRVFSADGARGPTVRSPTASGSTPRCGSIPGTPLSPPSTTASRRARRRSSPIVHARRGEAPDQPVDRERDRRADQGAPSPRLCQTRHTGGTRQRALLQGLLVAQVRRLAHAGRCLLPPRRRPRPRAVHVERRQAAHRPPPRLQGAELPYADGGANRKFSMYIYLPDGVDCLPTLLHGLSSDPRLLESAATMTAKVSVRQFRVPKFTMSYKKTVSAMLRNLGLTLPFDRDLADFGDLVDSPAPEPLYAAEVYHECFVEVNEEGTEAAAATAVAMGFGAAAVLPPPPEDFVADHPFTFLIKEDFSGVVVFAGQEISPSFLVKFLCGDSKFGWSWGSWLVFRGSTCAQTC